MQPGPPRTKARTGRWGKGSAVRRWLVWGVALITLAVFLAMMLWSLPALQGMAGGLVAFDLRPFGYSEGEARALLAALGDEGRAFCTVVPHRLDLVFPGLLAVTLCLTFRRGLSGVAGRVLCAVAVAGAGFDRAGNAAVAGLLASAEPAAEAHHHASRMTQAKSALLAVALVAAVVLLLRIGWRGLRAR